MSAPEPVSQLQKPLRPPAAFRASLVALAVLGAVCTAVVISGALQERVGALGAAVLLAAFVLAIVATLAESQAIPWGQRSLAHWMQPRVLGAIGSALLLAFGALFSMVPLLSNKEQAEALEQLDKEAASYQSVGWVVPAFAERAPENGKWLLQGSLFLVTGSQPGDVIVMMAPASEQSWARVTIVDGREKLAPGSARNFAVTMDVRPEGRVVFCLDRTHPLLNRAYRVSQVFDVHEKQGEERVEFVPASEPQLHASTAQSCRAGDMAP